jgi:hypothetical protein
VNNIRYKNLAGLGFGGIERDQLNSGAVSERKAVIWALDPAPPNKTV